MRARPMTTATRAASPRINAVNRPPPGADAARSETSHVDGSVRAARPQDGPGERDPDVAEDLDRDEEAGEQEDDAEQLPDEEAARAAEPVQPAGDRRDDRPDRDEDRGRDAAVQPAPEEGVGRPRQRRDQVDREGNDGQRQV